MKNLPSHGLRSVFFRESLLKKLDAETGRKKESDFPAIDWTGGKERKFHGKDKKHCIMARRTKRKVEKSLMVVDTKREIIDILQITNRRFMYNPQTGILILGDEAYGKSIAGSHAQEFLPYF